MYRQRAQAKDIEGYGTDLYENQTYIIQNYSSQITQPNLRLYLILCFSIMVYFADINLSNLILRNIVHSDCFYLCFLYRSVEFQALLGFRFSLWICMIFFYFVSNTTLHKFYLF